jgi:translin
MTIDRKAELAAVSEMSRASFVETHNAREQALRLSREIVRNSANSIRATHRAEYVQAHELLQAVSSLKGELDELLADHPRVYYAGFVEDAVKEYAEASATLSFAEGRPLAGPEELGIGAAPYMNAMAEAAGEMRRFILDALRRDDVSRCEELLGVMDDIYSHLVSMDFPDAVTRGLRRSTDMARGVLERTRGDLTVAIRQRRLEGKLAELQRSLGENSSTPTA